MKTWVAIVLVLLGAPDQNKIVHPFVDKEIGELIVGESTLLEFEKHHGKGVSFDLGLLRCYFNPDKKEFLIFALFPQCEKNILCSISIATEHYTVPPGSCKQAHINFDLVTGKGVALGDSSEKVLQLYGPPVKKQTIKGQIARLIYGPQIKKDTAPRSNYQADFRFFHNRLVYLNIHRSP